MTSLSISRAVTSCCLGGVILVLAGCSMRVTPPLPAATEACITSSEIAGKWAGPRATQLGPARTTYDFGCDCVLRIKSRLLWTTLRGERRFRLSGNTMRLETSPEPSLVEFTRNGDELTLRWSSGAEETLRLIEAKTCSSGHT